MRVCVIKHIDSTAWLRFGSNQTAICNNCFLLVSYIIVFDSLDSHILSIPIVNHFNA